MRNRTQIVIPMAGRGQRFRNAGFHGPKMLLEAAGKPMLYWALDSLKPHFPMEKVIFVCLQEHLEQTRLKSVISAYCKNPVIVPIQSVTGGQAETVLKAQSFIDPDEPLLIYNCDTYMESSIGTTIADQGSKADGIISVFPSYDPAYSYAQIDGRNRVVRVKEKEVISSMATTGLYYFHRSRLFTEFAEEAAARGSGEGELYVAPLYNRLIAQGYTCLADAAHYCCPLGTPEEIRHFEYEQAGRGVQCD
ncbi:glycosyltransferase family 2 protein [Paenibacillus lutrae]|uniref:NTP transferase domain-containing protein n=1 Tax=Paenibacillus lutrae TaxID=2078573 RepID=A0A7X3JY95_9BACL|nr:glycosyltransferase family 2 protein [Paenibacillus lutrae]MVO98836.1 NTP transferase domain-containing protein [Paenibacillus lutrae]